MESGGNKIRHIRESNRLSTQNEWEKRWAKNMASESLGFNPLQDSFIDLHRLFMRTLPVSSDLRFLEIGCYPGSYMQYFHDYYYYQITGLEYVKECCEKARKSFLEKKIPADIIHADFFDWGIDEPDMRFDVVASFGFVEHFSDVSPVLNRQFSLVKEGGYLIVVVPNHSGIYGEVLKQIDTEKYLTHNRMDLADLQKAMSSLKQAQIVEDGYFGRLGFWNCGLYSKIKEYGRLPYLMVRAPLWCMEKAARLLPNNSKTSPIIAAVIRKCSLG